MKEHEVSVTELRMRLNRYIDLVEEGNIIRITKYGNVIGYILPAQSHLENNKADRDIDDQMGRVQVDGPQDFEQIREEVKSERGKLRGRD
ncbi:MAG: type II toxin-antitoxin system Phd/YefM family antitoxin [Candidatus Hodarchaeales archaeon]